MLMNDDRRPWLSSVVWLAVFFTVSSGSDINCRSFRTGTLGKYIYPMNELADGVTTFNFSVKVMKYAYIMLSPMASDTTNQYEIAIGNSESANTAAIRRCRLCEDRKSVITSYRLLEYNEFKQFWVSFDFGKIQIGRYNETAFISWTDMYPLDIRFIGIATMRLPGNFIFCDIKFKTNQEVQIQGLLVLCVLFLPALVVVIKSYMKKLTTRIKHSNGSNNEDETDPFDDFYTTGIENQTVSQTDPNPPSYEKCMEGGRGQIQSTNECASTSYDSEPPPSYESTMANCLYVMNCDEQSDQSKCNISMWDSKSNHGYDDNLETFV